MEGVVEGENKDGEMQIQPVEDLNRPICEGWKEEWGRDSESICVCVWGVPFLSSFAVL